MTPANGATTPAVTPPSAPAAGEVSGLFGPLEAMMLQLRMRVAELEAELAAVRAERDHLREGVRIMSRPVGVPDEPITEAELHNLMHGPRGEPVEDILKRLEQRSAG